MDQTNPESTQEDRGSSQEATGPTRKSQLEFKKEWVVLYLGSRGMGKSTLMYFYMQKIPRFLIYDPLDQPLYRQYETYHAGTFDSLVDRVNEVSKNPRRGMKLRYVAYNDSDDEFERICKLVYKARVPFILVVEEVASHIRGHSMTKYFYRLVRMSRNHGKGIWITTQHPKMIPPKLRNNIDVVFSFRLNEPESIEYAKRWFGDGYDPGGLEPFGYYMWTSGSGGESALYKYPPLKVDSKLKKKIEKKGTGAGDIQELKEE